MDVIQIMILIIATLSLLIVTIFLILFMRKKNNHGNNDLKEFGMLENQISNLSKEMKTNIEIAIKDEMIAFNKLNDEKLQSFQSTVTDSLNKRFDSITDQDRKNNEVNNDKLERFQKGITSSLNERFDTLSKGVNEQLVEINKKVDEKLAEGFKSTNESMTQVRERLQAIDDAQKNLEGISKDVVSLKQVLEGNQSRGQYGELQLNLVLHNIFGDTKGLYEEQYTMKKVKDGDDVRADAVVFLPEPNKMICIDSKFPFQDYVKTFDDTLSPKEKEDLVKQFSNAVKKHITAIKDKYIVDGKTAKNAIMFIPNDGVFAFIHHNCQEVVDYAREKMVVITSPSTLPPILYTINMVRIQSERAKNVEELSKQLSKLSKDFEMFGREWNTFSASLDKAAKSKETFDNRVNRLTGKFESIKTNENVEKIENAPEKIGMSEE